MVCPDKLVTTSPGLLALTPGIFSQEAISPITSRSRSNSATVRIVPSTLAAPHMSYFISSRFFAGFKEMPPESKVMPLPTSTIGAAALSEVALLGVWRNTIDAGGSSDPAATDRQAD